MNRNLCKSVLSAGGDLVPLIISTQDSKGLGLMNPSILLDQSRILLNLRNINYTLFHCEGNQLFNNRFGPLAYLHPENDLHLRTYNFLCELDPNELFIKNYSPIDTSAFDKPPLWDFVGLEDIRLVRWDGKLYGCGVRRDTTPNGVGRMELSELQILSPNVVSSGQSSVIEVNRYRIDPPGEPTYCEKNWMPILDMPYHFVKWSNPTQVVKVDILKGTSETIFLSNSFIPNLPDFRGGSQVINWKKYRMAVIHEVSLFKNKLEQKDGQYRHRFLIWDRNWNLIKMSEPFSFMDGEIEFACGMTIYKNDILVTFGFQDNAAFVLRIPQKFFEDFVDYPNFEHSFTWGKMRDTLNKDVENLSSDILTSEDYIEIIRKEIFEDDVYQKFFKVEKNDIVVDIGASVGPFSYLIMNKNPKHVYCIEPRKELIDTIKTNLPYSNVTIINKGIADKNEEVLIASMFEDTSTRFLIDGIKFNTFIEQNNIEKIDFLKCDCEGAEYDIFNDENFEWINKNIKKIAAEIHVSTPELKNKFIKFKETYLKHFTNFQILSLDGVDIKWDLWNSHFLDYYSCVMLYIDNTIPSPIIKKEEKKKWQKAKWPSLEITTTVRAKGCAVNCVFCPQQVLIKSYDGERIMSFENFKKAIDKVPQEIVIIFSGFSEPWMNKQCTDMVLYAYEKGHPIAIFTTGVGMSIEDFERIKHIPFSLGPENAKISTKGTPIYNGGFTLHLPDNENYAKHPITDKYIQLLEHIAKSYNEVSFIRIVCMGTVHDKIKHIFPDAQHVDIWSRANNLNKEMELKPELKELEGKGLWLSAYVHNDDTTCHLDENVYHNVLMPNGDVVLCCMDYNQDHILGNLYTQEYDEIMPEFNKPFELCRYCENGVSISKL